MEFLAFLLTFNVFASMLLIGFILYGINNFKIKINSIKKFNDWMWEKHSLIAAFIGITLSADVLCICSYMFFIVYEFIFTIIS